MFPRWLSWVFLIALAYVVYVASQFDHAAVPLPAKSVIPPITREAYPSLAELTDTERWKRALNPDYAAMMNCTAEAPLHDRGLKLAVIEDVAGEGNAAACGQTITVHLTVWNANGASAYDGEFPLALGSRELASGLDFGLLGMKPGAVRRLVLPPYAIARGKKNAVPAAALKALAEGKVAVVTVKRVK